MVKKRVLNWIYGDLWRFIGVYWCVIGVLLVFVVVLLVFLESIAV